MRQGFRAPRAGVRSSLLGAAPVLLALLGACAPQDGYPKVTHRSQDELPAADYPNPPPAIAGFGQTAKLVATNLPAGVTQAMVDEGQTSFGTVCAACHGQNGTGSTSAPALNDAEWLWVPGGEFQGIVNIINAGVPAPKEHPAPMPPKGGGNFDDKQVRALAAYVYALSHQGGA